MKQNCIYLSKDTYVCSLYDASSDNDILSNTPPPNASQISSKTASANNTASAQNMASAQNIASAQNTQSTDTICNELDWFLNSGNRENWNRKRSTSTNCQAIYFPPEGSFDNHNDLAKHQACENAFEWYDRAKDAIFPSNGCLRIEFHKDMHKHFHEDVHNVHEDVEKDVTKDMHKSSNLQMPSVYKNGCMNCNIQDNIHGCLLQNKYFDSDEDATKKCKDMQECSFVTKHNQNGETRYYLRRSNDILTPSDRCMHKVVR